MLSGIIKKLQIILALSLVIGLVFYFTPLGELLNGEVEKKVEEFKKETKEKIETKKKEVKEKVESNIKEVEDKVKSNIKEVEYKIDSNIKELKKIKLRDIIG